MSVVAVLALGGLGGCGSDRSTEAFCGALDDGTAKLKSNTESAGDDMAGQFGLIMANIGDFTTMVHNLDEAAPEEIETEMHDAREAWDSNADRMEKAADSPLGALAAGIGAALMSSGSIRAVDQFASKECGTTVFGMSG